jgi:hypothetical protein
MAKDEDLANAFREAKQFLTLYDCTTLRKRRQICFAIMEAYRQSRITKEQSFNARQLILERLEPCRSVGEWLNKNVPDLADADLLYDRVYEVQEYRHRWLDDLIQEFG